MERAILGVLIKHMKHLQHRIQIIEHRQQQQQTSCNFQEDQQDSTGAGAGDGDHGRQSPEVEVRADDERLLLRVNCRKRKGVLVRLMSEVERLNLEIINASVTPFGNLRLDVTIVAEMGEEYNTTETDVAESLRNVMRRCDRILD